MATTPKTWQDGVLVTAADLNAEIRDPITTLQTTVGTLQPKGDYATNTALTTGLAAKAPLSHKHAAADLSGVVKTVNGTAPDAAGNVVVAGGTTGGGTATTDASLLTSGTLDTARMPGGSVKFTSGTTRPTLRTDIMYIFTGADPGAAAIDGLDFWWRPQA